MRLRELRNEELRTAGIRTTIRHGNYTRLVLEVVRLVVDGITRTTRSIAIRVATLDHEAGDNAMKEKSIVEPRICELDKVRNRIRSGLEVQVHNDVPLVGVYLGKNLGRSRVILVKNFSCGKDVCGKAEGTAKNKLFKQIVTSVVISFSKNISFLKNKLFT